MQLALGGTMEKFEDITNKINEFEKIIQYTFKDKNNIILALTHSSYANEYKNQKLRSNERLEFLGDTVLNMIISEEIYTKYNDLSEGEMTKFRSNVICEASLAECAKNLNIGKYLLLGKGEENTGGRQRASILSDAVEALIGALYLDAGLEKAKSFVLAQMGEMIEKSIKGIIFMDYKTQLQEILQRGSEKKVAYEIIDEKGPDHDKIFVSQVKINGKPAGKGKGKTKKEAEQMAAKETIKTLENHI
jgi:ribonuclease-3